MGGSTNKAILGVDPPRIGPMVVLATLAINLLALVLPVVLLQIFDRIVPYQSYDTMLVLFGLLAIALTLDFFLKAARVVILGHMVADFEVTLGIKALRKILASDSAAFLKDTFGTHTDRLAAVNQLRDYYGGQGRLLQIDLPFTAIFICMIWYIGGWLVAVPLTCVGLLVLVSLALRHLQEKTLQERHSVDRRRYSFLAEVLEQITTVKGCAAEDQMKRRQDLLQDQSAKATTSLVWVASLSQSFSAVFGQFAVVALGAFGGWLAMNGMIGMAELAACMLLNGRTIQPMLRLLGLWVQLESVRSAESGLTELADVPEPARIVPHEGAIDANLEFKDVSLEPANREKPVFIDLNATVPTGQIAMIDAGDGSGRSSLMRMLLGEQQPTSGSIRIGGIDPAALRTRRGIGEIAYVHQKPAIFTGTILENLSLFGGRASQDAAIHAAERIGLTDDVFAMPLGFDTMIGPGGDNFLPTGTLQKIAIARALGQRPSLLLLNSAASSIDVRTRKRIAQVLLSLRGRTTLVVVSQMLVTKPDADVIIKLKNTNEEAPSTSPALARWIADAQEEAAATMSLQLGSSPAKRAAS